MALGDVLLTRDDIVRWLMDLPTPMGRPPVQLLSRIGWSTIDPNSASRTPNELKRHFDVASDQ